MSRNNLADQVEFRQIRVDDLELLIAWRSNPLIYKHLRDQDEALDWRTHIEWFDSRSDERIDYIIEYRGRRVGSVSVTEDRFVGVYVGEISLWGQGIGEYAVNWICERHGQTETLFAEVHKDNISSRRLFEKCGFSQDQRDCDWIIYRR